MVNIVTSPQVLAADDEFDFDAWMAKQPKPEPVPLNLPDDPVALSCACYRIWLHTGVRWSDLENTTVHDEDRARASELRKYYAGQMTFDALKGGGLKTQFRKKLYAIATNCHTYTKEDIGLLHRLPYFYEEDLTLDNLVTDFTSVEIAGSKELRGIFSLHKKMLRGRRAGEYHYYWLKQDGSPYLYNLVVKSDSALRPLVESVLASPREFTATAYYKGMQGQRRFNYIQLGNMRLV